MTERPKLPPEDPYSEEAELARLQRDEDRRKNTIPSPIEVAIKRITDAEGQ